MEGKLIVTKEFTPAEQEKIKVLAQKIDFTQRQSIVEFGADAQAETTRLDEKILEKVKAKDADEVGALLTELVLKAKEIDVTRIGRSESGLSKLPVIGSWFSQGEKIMARYSTLTTQIELIADKLQAGRRQLTEHDVMLDKLYAANSEHYQNLTYYIAAGQLRLTELAAETAHRQSAAEASGDEMEAQQAADYQQMAERLEIKLHNLALSREICAQTARQIRLIQGGNQLLAEKVQTTLLQTVPLWKRQMVIALTLVGQKKTVELQQAVDKTTNDLLLKNSEMLKNNTIDIARANQRGIIDMETLQKVHENFLTTIDEVVKISAEGHSTRQASMAELDRLAAQRRTKLIGS